jgi:hypothetical protein
MMTSDFHLPLPPPLPTTSCWRCSRCSTGRRRRRRRARARGLRKTTQTRAQRPATSPLLRRGPASQRCWTRSRSPTPTTPAAPSAALSSPRTRTVRIVVSIAGGSAELEVDDHRARLLDIGRESDAGHGGEASRSAPPRKHRSRTRYAVVSAEKPSRLAARDAHPTAASRVPTTASRAAIPVFLRPCARALRRRRRRLLPAERLKQRQQLVVGRGGGRG